MWLSTEDGRHFNTDWADKDRQIAANESESAKLNQEDYASRVDRFDVRKLGELNDADDLQTFIKSNLHNPEFKQFGRERGTEAVRQLWYETKRQQEIKNLHEMPIEDAIAKVREAIPKNHSEGWFREANSEYKPHIAAEMFSNKGTYNAAMNIAYDNYKNSTDSPMPFNQWLTTPQTVYRGTSGQRIINSDVFTSYTPDKKVAEGFAFGTHGKAGSQHGGEGKISSMTIRPIDTWGSLQTTGEQEFMIPLTIEDKSEHRGH